MSRCKKIAMFLPSLEIGGVERVMLNLARGLAQRACQVNLVVAQEGRAPVYQVPLGVHLVNLHTGRIVRSLLPLVQYLRSVKPDVLISAKDYANIIAILAKRIACVKVCVIPTVHTVVSIHTEYAPCFREKVIVPNLARWLYPYADAIVAVSKSVASDLTKFLRLSSEDIVVIYNPVISRDIFSIARQKVEHPWFSLSDQKIILSIGRLTKAKDYPTLISAFAKVRSQRSARLVILGDGEERAHLQKLIQSLGLESEVWLPGFIVPPYSYLARASLFAMSSIWEGLPTALIEALALGIPVVSTDCPGGVREILADGKFGKIVPVGDSVALAQAILDSLDAKFDPNFLRERAEAFSEDRAVNEYLKLFDQLIEGN